MRHATYLLLALTACGTASAGGAAKVGTDVRKVAAFTSIATSGSWDVDVEVGPATHVEVTAEDSVRPLIRTVVNDHVLHIDAKGSWNTHEKMHVKVTTPSLDAVASTGSGDIDVDGVSGSMSVANAGSGEIALDGALDQLTIALAGSGAVEARQAPAASAAVQLDGSGSVEVTAKESLSIALSGSGSVDYWGSPQVSKAVSGSGRVHAH